MAHRSPWLDGLIVFLAQYLAYIMVLGFIILLFKEKKTRRKVFFILEAVLALLLSRGILTETIRFFYNHPRPFDALAGVTSLIPESGASFPSGHMAFFFALTFVVWLMSRRWGWAYGVLALVMGVARIAAGVHWPADILGGILTGLLSGWLVWISTKKYLPVKEGQVI